MTRNDQTSAPTDAELVAYLDGEMSPADSVRINQRLASDDRLAARMEHLMRGARPFREAFDPLLADAPLDRLEAMLEATSARPVESASRRHRVFALRSWPAAAAAAMMLMAAGVGLDRLAVPPLQTPASRPDGSDEWRQAVAQYLSLYTRDTLANIPDSGNASESQLASVGLRLNLTLTPSRVDLTDLTLKRADVYDYDGKALAFLAYLDPHNGPVALCITEGPRGSDAQRLEQRRGMNVVYWSQGRHSFMLIGRSPPTQLQALATTVASRFEKGDDHG